MGGANPHSLLTNEKAPPAPPHPSAACISILILLVCTSTNGFFSFLTRAGELTSGIRLSISNETVRRDIHHPRAPGGRAESHPFRQHTAARQALLFPQDPLSGPFKLESHLPPCPVAQQDLRRLQGVISIEVQRCPKCRQGSGTPPPLMPIPHPCSG